MLAKKGTGTPTSLTYSQALEEALCFGWIDGPFSPLDLLTRVDEALVQWRSAQPAGTP